MVNPTPDVIKTIKQVATRLLSSRYRDVFAPLVPSCCDKSGTSCYHLVTRLMTVTDLPQFVPTRLIQAVRNKFATSLLSSTCKQLVTYRRYRTYYTRENAQVVTGLQTSCYKSVHKLSTSCVRTACSQLL
jgi:hypothetical protein